MDFLLKLLSPLAYIFHIFHKICIRLNCIFWNCYTISYLYWVSVNNKKKLWEDNIKFNGHTTLYIKGKLKIGRNFICNSGKNYSIDSTPCAKIRVMPNAYLEFGENSGISNTIIHCYNNIKIGNNVNIGAGCMIFDTNFHSINWQDRKNRIKDVNNAKTSPIRIDDFVFIGANCIICKGVLIGAKSMVAAGSVVVSNIPSGEIWGGNPAKFIKKIENPLI